jgi:prepilin-type N-terminal cleavage/methylation domain-containing protein
MEKSQPMNRGIVRPSSDASRRRAPSAARGFSLIELLFVIAIGLILTLIAMPLVMNVSSYLRLRSATASLTGAIQSTRYNAIYQGYPYTVTFSKATSTIQVANQPPGASGFVNVGNAMPFSTSPKVQLGADVTLQFSPSGVVRATAGTTTLTLTGGNRTATIVVSSYGNTNVTYTP